MGMRSLFLHSVSDITCVLFGIRCDVLAKELPVVCGSEVFGRGFGEKGAGFGVPGFFVSMFVFILMIRRELRVIEREGMLLTFQLYGDRPTTWPS